MAMKPFPELASAENSRSASPASDARKKKSKGRGKGRGKKPVRRDENKPGEHKAETAGKGPRGPRGPGKQKADKPAQKAGGGPKPADGASKPAGEGAKPAGEASAPAARRRPSRRRSSKKAAPRSLSNGMLTMATIVAGENGQARVQLGPVHEHQQPIPGMGSGVPRFSSSDVMQRRSSTGRFGRGGLGLAGPEEQRQRAMTQLRAEAAPFMPRRATERHRDPPGAPPDSRRTRSQSAVGLSATGLRIALAQPGNVMAPHVGQTGRACGYFEARRASVSSAGLAVDPSHSIHIPAIMFRQRSDCQLATPTSAEPPESGESLAMRRLQEMIASMRELGGAQDKAIGLPPTPAAHPSARFDSILEEDEDSDEDEARLDAEDSSDTALDPAPGSQKQPAVCAL
ncbi:hypothetical protein LPJ78_000728 [Coemansia sp. RSA 989]|nr:hypothetical protein BX667DRAFT_415711 [Coemansia mojavensis]KAJ1743918.1 hypothetical protein LPJ68_000454 [Coemansia sp. RSA 1086]KAJ1753316.1 hypothetical protein LPJ79_000403 [Coemansia sp. RSA 1821]KAJ1867676.1 hypothetical protein LPJ78_000728 [Coemansia sp. RSA 989]KAJ1870316.1 hypothetical protein LPJ55_004748 [Coemansia sp. RSA 990]KAJ2673841.1 hypothetical protein IWW42_001971 [Coemansia sp. RSA 1085]